MYPVNEVARIFFECFDGSAIEMFRAFLRQHPQVRKWMIAADFSLHNKDRPLECFAFTILPYDAWLHEVKQDASALPKDLKKSKSLDDEAIDWLREPKLAAPVRLRFHFVQATPDTTLRPRSPHGCATRSPKAVSYAISIEAVVFRKHRLCAFV